jgi:iron complex outermembrane receptor protein
MMKVRLAPGIMLLFLSFSNQALFSQKTEDLIPMSLEDILNMNVVSVSKRSENLFSSPLSVSVITHEDIESSGATTIEELFRWIPGMIVRETTHGNFDIHVRGNDNIPPGNFTNFSVNTMTLVMIDGRRVYNTLNGGTFWETLPVCLGDIERIEVIRGPASSLYGSNAVSGVIHFITRNADETHWGIQGKFEQGMPAASLGEFSGHYRPAGNLGLRFSGHVETRNRFENSYYGYSNGRYSPYDELINYQTRIPVASGDPRFDDHSVSKKQWGSTFNLQWNPAVDTELDFSAGVQNSRAQTVFTETSTTPLSFRTAQIVFGNLIFKTKGLNFQLSGQQGTQNIYEGVPYGYEFDLSQLDGSLEYEWHYQHFTFRPGFDYQQAVYDDRPYLTDGQLGHGYINDRRELSSFAFFIRGEYQPVDPVRLVAGIRSEKYKYPEDPYCTYQVATTFQPSENHLFRAVLSRANRGPFISDVYSNFSETTEYMLIEYEGNHNLRLPTMDMLEAGYRAKLSRRLQLDMEAFFTKTRDFMSFEPDVLTIDDQGLWNLVYHYKNINARSEQVGITAALSAAFGSKLHGRIFTTWQQTRLENFDLKIVPLSIAPDYSNVILPRTEKRSFIHKHTPPVYGGFAGTWMPFRKWNITVSAVYWGPFIYRHDYATLDDDKGETQIKAKIIPAFYISYRMTSYAALSLTVKNGFMDQPEYGFAESIGPSVFGGLRWTWPGK